MRKAIHCLLACGLVALVAACVPLKTPGDTSKIALVSTTTLDGWKYDFYRNNAYPCSISGFQTFVVGTKVGSDLAAPAPLFVHMHGGGAGYFDANGNPIPGTGQKVEQNADSLGGFLQAGGLSADVRADAAGFRMVAVSYCNQDVYAGALDKDPNNPNLDANGNPRTTNGLLATKAAIQYAQSQYPTTKTFVRGTSAGSAGAFGVAWAMEQQGIPPAGVIADASIINQEAFQAAFNQGVCTDDNDPARTSAIAARVAPELRDISNEPDKLVASGRLTVPIMHVWNHGDSNTCGSTPITCPLRNGSQTTMGVTDCIREPMREAIAAEGANSRSRNLPVCVDLDTVPDCSTHVTTTRKNAVNTDPASPSDYIGAIVDWMHARLADT